MIVDFERKAFRTLEGYDQIDQKVIEKFFERMSESTPVPEVEEKLFEIKWTISSEGHLSDVMNFLEKITYNDFIDMAFDKQDKIKL